MNDTAKNILWSVLSVLLISLILLTIVPISYQNSVADAEVFVQTQVNNCAQTRDAGINSILEVAQVDQNTKEFLVRAIEAASPDQKATIDSAYTQFVAGNTQPFMMLMSGLAGTDLTATAQNLQREIVSQRSNMLRCALELNQSQQAVRNTLGYNASNQVTKFPQKYMHLELSEISDVTLQDNDFDGRTTVLDYRAPISAETIRSFGSGADNTGTLNIYGNP